MSGVRIRSDTSNGMIGNKWVDQSTPAFTRRTRIGNMEASMNPILSIMVASGRCGTSPDQDGEDYIVRGYSTKRKPGRSQRLEQASRSLHRPGRKSLRLLRHSIPEWLPGRVFARDARQTKVARRLRPVVVVRSQSAIKQIFPTGAEPVQILGAEDRGWHSGSHGNACLLYSEDDSEQNVRVSSTVSTPRRTRVLSLRFHPGLSGGWAPLIRTWATCETTSNSALTLISRDELPAITLNWPGSTSPCFLVTS